MKCSLFVAATLFAVAPLTAQSLAERIARAPDGTVHLTYSAREGVCGNGAGMISFDCENGHCGRRRITTNSDWDDDTPCACDSGPVRLALQVTNGHVTRLRSYVGGHWKPAAGVTDLGTVAAPIDRMIVELADRERLRRRSLGC